MPTLHGERREVHDSSSSLSPSPSTPPEPHVTGTSHLQTHAIPGSPQIWLSFCFSETLTTLLSCLFSLLKSLTSFVNVRADSGSVRASLLAPQGCYQTWQHFSAVRLRSELPEPSDFTGSCICIYIYLSFYPSWHHLLGGGAKSGKICPPTCSEIKEQQQKQCLRFVL